MFYYILIFIENYMIFSLSFPGTMSMGIKNSWSHMSQDAKLKKLLLIEGLCESLRSSLFEGDYRTWSQQRLGKVFFLVFFWFFFGSFLVLFWFFLVLFGVVVDVCFCLCGCVFVLVCYFCFFVLDSITS